MIPDFTRSAVFSPVAAPGQKITPPVFLGASRRTSKMQPEKRKGRFSPAFRFLVFYLAQLNPC
jgi:hypothetical protein